MKQLGLVWGVVVCLAVPQLAFGAKAEVLSRYHVTPKNKIVMDRIAELFEVEHRHGNGYDIIVPKNRAGELVALDPSAKLIDEDINQYLNALNGEALRGYHNFQTVQDHLNKIAFQHPDVAKIVNYGSSKEGRPLLALKLSDNVQTDESEPELMITSATHGDELISVEVLFGILDAVVDGYANRDPRFVKMIEEKELFFIPVINPDGYVIQSRYSNGVDPNRDYPWPEKPSRTPNPCIQAVMDFFHARDIKGSMDLHASGQMIMYPWAYTSTSVPAADENVFDAMTRKMASFNGYTFGQISEVIYVAKGSSADYYYWKKKTLALGIEIGTSKVPPSSSIPGAVNQMLDATWSFVEHF